MGIAVPAFIHVAEPLPGLILGPAFVHQAEGVPLSIQGPAFIATVESIPLQSLGPIFDHVALAAPTTTTGPLHDAFVDKLPAGFGAIYDHDAIKAPPSTAGPSFDHNVQAVIPPDWVFGPIYDSFTSPGIFSSVGPLTDAAPVMPSPLSVLDPDTPVSVPSRNTLAPSEVSFKSPGTYGLEKDPITGKITGSKLR